jgi:tetratricopeptide (TPR) repeat protein
LPAVARPLPTKHVVTVQSSGSIAPRACYGRAMRALVVVVIVAVATDVSAGPRGVDASLRELADRAARYALPAGLAPVVKEHVAAGDLGGLTAVIDTVAEHSHSMKKADDAWLAADYGAVGDRARVESLAQQVEDALTKTPDERIDDAARCAVALGFEYLGDTAQADRWRANATSVVAFCDDELPLVAAQLGRHDRARELLSGIRYAGTRVKVLLGVARIYADAKDASRAAAAATEAATIAKTISPSLANTTTDPELAVVWMQAGRSADARATAKRALASLEVNAKGDDTALLINGAEVAAALAAVGDTAALASLVARMEKARASDDRLVARVQNARLIAKFGSKSRGAALVAATAKAVESDAEPQLKYAMRFALIDAYLALGDIASAIDQASRTAVITPMEPEALLVIARHCRKTRCPRTKTIDAALAEVSRHLDRIDASRARP